MVTGTALSKTHIVTIDQASIHTAPAFPRDVEWWRGFLPVWFSDRTVYERLKATGKWTPDMSRITVDPQTDVVSIVACDKKHGRQIFEYLTDRAVLRRFLPDGAINLQEQEEAA